MTGEVNSVIDLIFLRSGSTELSNHSICSDWQLSLDHAPLTVIIPIAEENIISSKFSIAKNSEEEESFINDVSYAIKNINVNDLSDSNKLEVVTNMLVSKIKNAWRANSKRVNIMRQSNSWWNKKCSIALSNYRTTWSLENWKTFKSKVKTTKWLFSNIKIQEIANKNEGLGSSWIGLINANYLPLKPSSTTINNVLISTTCGICFIPRSIQLSIIKLMSRSLIKYPKNQPSLGPCFQRKSSESL